MKVALGICRSSIKHSENLVEKTRQTLRNSTFADGGILDMIHIPSNSFSHERISFA